MHARRGHTLLSSVSGPWLECMALAHVVGLWMRSGRPKTPTPLGLSSVSLYKATQPPRNPR
eukprot:scaffold3296_cov405-Prasinococcus_capsulatus_cf.AAC.9